MRDQKDYFLFLVKTWFQELFRVVAQGITFKLLYFRCEIDIPLKSAAVLLHS